MFRLSRLTDSNNEVHKVVDNFVNLVTFKVNFVI